MKTTHNAKILGYPQWIARGLEEACKKGEWQAWEQQVLALLITDPECCFEEAIEYAKRVRREPWPDLEAILVNPPASWTRPDESQWFPLYDYINEIGYSPSLENLILHDGCGVSAFLYARLALGRQWEQAESLILRQDTPTSCASLPSWLIERVASPLAGFGNSIIGLYASHFGLAGWPAFEQKVAKDDCHPISVVAYVADVLRKPWEPAEAFLLRGTPSDELMRAVVLYAKLVVLGRWETAEHLLLSSTKRMWEYADTVIRGRLPDNLHTTMMLKSFQTPDDPYVKEYIKKYGV